MSRNKGFTLVELLAMLVVLGIIIAIAIPNINNILKNQRKNQFIADATSMVETAKIKAAKNNDKPTNGKCIIYSLDYLNDNDNINEGPNGGEYDQYESYVIYKRENSSYKYYVKLVEKISSNNIKGITDKTLTEVKNLTESDIQSVSLLGITKDNIPSTSLTKIKNNSTCSGSNVEKYYRTYCIQSNGTYYDINGNTVTAAEYNKTCGLSG